MGLAKKYDALLYVDDAHGFGVVGERPDLELPYGYRGNGLVRHFDLDYDSDNILYIAGFSKAYSSLAAGLTCSKRFKQFIKAYATPYDLSGPSPTASLASLLMGLSVNDARGDMYRHHLWNLTQRAINGLRQMGFGVRNSTGFPIVTVWIGDTEQVIRASDILLEHGVLVTLAPYPMVPKGQEVLRITLTAANTVEEVEQSLLLGFSAVRDYLGLGNVAILET